MTLISFPTQVNDSQKMSSPELTIKSEESPLELRKKPSFYRTASTKSVKALNSVWSGIKKGADAVADFLGVTAPKYELYLDDARQYQEEVCLFSFRRAIFIKKLGSKFLDNAS